MPAPLFPERPPRPLSANGPHRKGGWAVELAAALLSVLAPLAPAVKGWLDSAARRNRGRCDSCRSWDARPKREDDDD